MPVGTYKTLTPNPESQMRLHEISESRLRDNGWTIVGSSPRTPSLHDYKRRALGAGVQGKPILAAGLTPRPLRGLGFLLAFLFTF